MHIASDTEDHPEPSQPLCKVFWKLLREALNFNFVQSFDNLVQSQCDALKTQFQLGTLTDTDPNRVQGMFQKTKLNNIQKRTYHGLKRI